MDNRSLGVTRKGTWRRRRMEDNNGYIASPPGSGGKLLWFGRRQHALRDHPGWSRSLPGFSWTTPQFSEGCFFWVLESMRASRMG